MNMEKVKRRWEAKEPGWRGKDKRSENHSGKEEDKRRCPERVGRHLMDSFGEDLGKCVSNIDNHNVRIYD